MATLARLESAPGLAVEILVGGEPLKQHQDQFIEPGNPNEVLRYVEFSKEEPFEIRVHIARGSQKGKNGIDIDLRFDGGDAIQHDLIESKLYRRSKHVECIKTLFVEENGVAKEVTPMFRILRRNEDTISEEGKKRFSHVGEIEVSLTGVLRGRRPISPKPDGGARRFEKQFPERPTSGQSVPGQQSTDHQSANSESRDAALDGRGRSFVLADTNVASQFCIAGQPIPEKGLKGKDISHGVVLEEVNGPLDPVSESAGLETAVPKPAVPGPAVPESAVLESDIVSDDDSVLGNVEHDRHDALTDLEMSSDGSEDRDVDAWEPSAPKPRRKRQPKSESVYFKSSIPSAKFTFRYRTRNELIRKKIIKLDPEVERIIEEQVQDRIRLQGAPGGESSDAAAERLGIKRERDAEECRRVRNNLRAFHGTTIEID